MALDVTGTALATARRAAKNAVRDAYLAIGRELTDDEKAQMMFDTDKADSAAILAYFVANAVVVGVAAGAMAGGPGVPVAGTVT